jgi:hypothetical protein
MSVKHFQIAAFSILAFLLVYTPWPNRDETQAFMQATGTDDIYTFITGQLPKVKHGAVAWEVFEKVKEIKVKEIDKDEGFEIEYFKPEYTEEVKNMNGKTIKLMGFMFPLTATKEQTLFLIGPFALSCPFHYHVNPKFAIEIESTRNPIEFTYEQILIEGRFELGFDKDNQIFYYLKDAKLIKKNL